MKIKPFKKSEVSLGDLYFKSSDTKIEMVDSINIEPTQEGLDNVNFLLDNLKEIKKSLTNFPITEDAITLNDYEPFVGNDFYENEDYTVDNAEDRVAIYGNLNFTKDGHSNLVVSELINFLEHIKDYVSKQDLTKTENTTIVNKMKKNPFN